jgi:hypothetical protein
MQGHGLATLFLAGVCKEVGDDKRHKQLVEVLTRAVKYIVKAQSSQGGWYHTSRVEGHDFAEIDTTVVQIQALQAAENAGIPVATGVIVDAREYLQQAITKYDKIPFSGAPSRRIDLAAVLACHVKPRGFARGSSFEPLPAARKWFKDCQAEFPVGREIKFGRDELPHYYYAQAMFDVGGDSWTSYRAAMFDHLKSSQHKDGSWPAGDGLSVGPIYATAIWCIVLQLDGGSHPVRPGEPLEISSRRLDPQTEGRRFG